jgi:hypothetical protein
MVLHVGLSGTERSLTRARIKIAAGYYDALTINRNVTLVVEKGTVTIARWPS